MDQGRLDGLWRLWRIGALVWVLLLLGLGLLHMPWPSVEDLRRERLTAACWISPFGQDIALNTTYSEAQIREMDRDPEFFARVIAEAGKNGGSKVSPELMKYAGEGHGSTAEQRAEQTEKWSPRLKRCINKMDVDYKALRRRQALLSLTARINLMISVPLFFLIFLAMFSIRRRFV